MAPDILLMDEPTSAIDPIATARIEELINELKSTYTIVIVTHNMQQAAGSPISPPSSTRAHRGVRPHPDDLHQSHQSPDRRLHHRPLRLSMVKVQAVVIKL